MRVVIYDDNCSKLTWLWALGAKFFVLVGKFDACYGAATWGDALKWLLDQGKDFEEIQFWGHGNWGAAIIGDTRLNSRSINLDYSDLLLKLKEIVNEDTVFWFRSCNIFGAKAGAEFALNLRNKLGCSVAGHTYIVWIWHSGLCYLRPGGQIWWPLDESFKDERSTIQYPGPAKWSMPWHRGTVCFLRMRFTKK